MNTKTIISKFAIALLLSPLAPSAFAVDTGTINFTGTISATACKLDGNYGYTKNVAMGDVSPSLIRAGYAGTPVKLAFTECHVAGTNLNVKFPGVSATGQVALTQGDDAATGVAIQLSKDTTNFTANHTIVTKLENNAATVDFNAKYVQMVGTSITTGSANATTAIEVSYN